MMELSYKYSLADFRAMRNATIIFGRRMYDWHIFLAVLGVVCVLILIVFGALLREQGLVGRIAWIILFAISGGTAFNFVISPIAIRSTYRRNQIDDKLVTLKIAEKGVVVSGTGSETSLDWTCVLRADKYKDYRFLWLNGAQAIVIPNRCFNAEADRTKFDTLITSQLGERAKGL